MAVESPCCNAQIAALGGPGIKAVVKTSGELALLMAAGRDFYCYACGERVQMSARGVRQLAMLDLERREVRPLTPDELKRLSLGLDKERP